jgi:hypothetical protein
MQQLKRELTLANDDANSMELRRDIRRQRAVVEKVKRKMHLLRSQIVTSSDLTSARDDVRRAQDEIEQEEESRVQLVEALVDTFFAYDLDTSPWLPKCTMSTKVYHVNRLVGFRVAQIRHHSSYQGLHVVHG